MARIDEDFIEELYTRIQKYFRNKPWPPDMEEEEVERVIEEYQDTIDAAENRGLYVIGEGRDRLTFESRSNDVIPEDCILKITKTDGQQNREAIEIRDEMDEEARKCIVPFVEWDDGWRWIVQRQASHTAKGSEEVRERLKEAGWTCSDIRSENIGEYDGRKVLLDLGVGLRKI